MKKTLLALLLGTLFIPNVIFAQTASSTLTSVQVAELIAQLQAQIKELQAQLVTIQQGGNIEVTSSAEFVAVSEFTQTLSRGMESEEVKELQRFLAQNPEVYPEGVITGYFGALTEAAVKRFQEAHGLPSVGIVGPKTRAVLNENTSSGGGGSGVAQVAEQTTATASTPPPPAPTPAPQAVTPPPPVSPTSTPTPSSTGSYYVPGGYYQPTATYVSEPTPPVSPPPPSSDSSATSTASSTPETPPPPPPSPPPAPTNDTTGPTITSLSITPTSAKVGGAISFSATAEDPSGIRTVVYLIQYPGVSIVLGPNCNYNGVTVGTCGFGEPIDHARQNPSVLGDYTITIRAVDMLDNVSLYYPDGTVTNGVNATHSLTIPAITISAP